MKHKNLWKRFAAIMIIAVLTGAVLSGCGGSGAGSAQDNYITIGCVSPLSGELAPYGEGSLELEEAAVKEINENGGIYIDTLEKKMRIRFVIADSKSTEAGAKEAAKKLIEEEQANVVIASSGTMTAVAAASVCEPAKVPFFSVNAENDAWKESGSYQYSVNCAYDNTSRLEALLDILQEAGITSVGLLSVKSEEADRFAATLSEFAAANGLKLTAPESADPVSPDFSKAVSALASAKVGALICYMDSKEFSDAWGSANLKGLGASLCVLIDNDLFAGDIAKIEHGGDIKEFYTLTTWDRKYPFESSLNDETANELGLWWEDTFLSGSSELTGSKYAAAEIAIDALKLAMALDPESIASATRSMNVDTMVGTVDFGNKGYCILPCSVLKWTFEPSTVSWSKELVSHARLVDVEFEDE